MDFMSNESSILWPLPFLKSSLLFKKTNKHLQEILTMCLKRSSRIFLEIHFEGRDQYLVREKGLEPPRIAAQDSKTTHQPSFIKN